MSVPMTAWTVSTLGKVADWGSGGTPKAGTAAYYGGEIPWAVIGDLNDGKVLGTATSITQEGLSNSSAKIVPDGCVLIAMYGSIGKLGLPEISMATNQAIAFAKPHEGVLDRRFLFWFLMSERERLARAGKGATQQNISQTILKAWPIAYPPFDEQQRIVAILEDHLSRLDAALTILRGVSGRTGLTEVTSKGELLRRSLLHAAFTGRLGVKGDV